MIKLENIRKVYGNKDNRCVAINNLTLRIKKNEFVALCGTSGSGKTTLFNIIGGIDREYEGKCIIDGVDIHGLSENDLIKNRRKQIGMIFQFFNLIPSLTVADNIMLTARLNGQKADINRLKQVLEQLDLLDKQYAFIHELSGGQKQRVAIGRVLYMDAQIILADEPTGNLDSENTMRIMELFKAMKDKTIVMITHDEKVAQIADRIVYMKDGELCYE